MGGAYCIISDVVEFTVMGLKPRSVTSGKACVNNKMAELNVAVSEFWCCVCAN